MRSARAESPTVASAVEVAAGLLVLALVTWLGYAGWRFYTVSLLPQARVVPTATATAVPDPEALKAEGRRFRLVQDHVGAGIAFRQANRPDLAIQEFRAALDLDPTNFEARQNLAEMGITMPPLAAVNTPILPAPTAIPTVTPRP